MGTLTRSLASNITVDGKISSNRLTGKIPASAIDNNSLSNVTEFSNLILEFDRIINLSSDPSPLEEGQIWYNTTSNDVKIAVYDTNTSSVVAKVVQLS